MGKNLLVLSATAFEIAPFIQALNKGETGNKHIDVLITGIGLTASTYHLSKQLLLKKYDLVLQAGVAGSFTASVPPGAVVAISQDTIADQSVVELKKMKTLFDLNLVPHNQYPYQNGWLNNPHKEIIKKSGMKIVKGISVNQISTSKQTIRFYREMFNPVTESMEGSALHYICLMEKIPFLQIRSISNMIGERNKKKWNMNDSVLNLNKSLMTIINNF